MDFFSQIKSELNRLHGTSFDDSTSEAEVADALEKINPDMTAEDYRKEVSELNTQMESLDTELKATKESNKALEAQVTELRTSLDEATSSSETISTDLSAASDKIKTLEAKLDELSAVVAGKKAVKSTKSQSTMPDLGEAEKSFLGKVQGIKNESKY